MRWGSRPVEPEPADEAFPFLTAAEGSRLRSLVRTAFAESGREVVVGYDHVVETGGTEYGLANLAASCHQHRDDWPQLVSTHVARITSAMEQHPLDELGAAEIRENLYPRLVSRDQLPALVTYGREIAGDLVEVLNLDLPTTVAYLTDEHVRRLGPAGPLFDAARANLGRVQPGEHQVLPAGGTSFHCLMDESMYTATTLLTLDRIAGSIGTEVDDRLGAFAVVPFRHQLAFHAWRGDLAAVAAIQGLSRFAELGFADAPGALSPCVWWWRPGGIEQVTFVRDGKPVAEIRGELAELLNQAR